MTRKNKRKLKSITNKENMDSINKIESEAKRKATEENEDMVKNMMDEAEKKWLQIKQKGIEKRAKMQQKDEILLENNIRRAEGPIRR